MKKMLIIVMVMISSFIYGQKDYKKYDSPNDSKFAQVLNEYFEQGQGYDLDSCLRDNIIIVAYHQQFFIDKDDIDPMFQYLMGEYNPKQYTYRHNIKDDKFYMIQCTSDDTELLIIFELDKKGFIDTIYIVE